MKWRMASSHAQKKQRSSVLLTFGFFSFHDDFHRFPFAPELALCSRLFSGFDFVLVFDFVFPPIFLRDSVPPCLRGEYWVLVVAQVLFASLALHSAVFSAVLGFDFVSAFDLVFPLFFFVPPW